MTTVSSPFDSRYNGDEYDGIVRVSIGGYYGSGTLLYDGKAILTGAHVLSGTNDSTANVMFEIDGKKITKTSDKWTIYPSYVNDSSDNDIAIIWLNESAHISSDRYQLYRQSDEILKTFTMVGYGTPGTGNNGTYDDYNDIIKLTAKNQFDITGDDLKSIVGRKMAWTPPNDTQLIADFDSGSSTNDALGVLAKIYDTGLGIEEGIIAGGDSGGPALIDNKISGIASYGSSLSSQDVNNEINSSFGEIAAWQRVSYYQQWIDQELRKNYTNAPKNIDEVNLEITEGSDGLTTLAYFLVKILGIRQTDTLHSVDYTTIDGTAKAGEDYIAANGTLVLYENEDYAVIPVEIISDTKVEENETFYLSISNPQGANFAENAVTLTAMRTIIDDDGLLLT